jgi:hypothetical protein
MKGVCLSMLMVMEASLTPTPMHSCMKKTVELEPKLSRGRLGMCQTQT